MLALYGILISSKTVMCWRESRGGLLAGSQVSTIGVQALLLLHQLHLEPLEERRRISQLTFLYKILNEHVVVPMNQLDLLLCGRPVRGSTTKQRLKIPHCASTQFKKSFAARTITEWNSLPDSITLLKPAVCYIMPGGEHTALPKYPSGDWRLLSRSRSRSR